MKNRSSLKIFTLILFVLASFALLSQMQAAPQVAPPPDGCYPGFTTAEGCKALQFLGAGAGNTGVGWYSLYLVGDGNYNTGVGAGTLVLNTGDSNTAVGAAAMLLNDTGTLNTAIGTDALVHNDNGSFNNAVGGFALFNNMDGAHNIAVGYQALFANVSGLENTAIGDQALLDNTGNFNVAAGGAALLNNTSGNQNTACGGGALNDNTIGNDNTAIGFQAGIFATGDGNVYVGSGMSGVGGESNHTYVRNINTTTVSGGNTDSVTVNLTTGLVGHLSSSRRYKENIKPMQEASEALFALNPVTFRYKKEIDQSQTLDYGLIAEEVAKIDPNLAIRDKNGQVESVRYSAINAMLLNEFLKEHRKVEEQTATIAELKSTVAKQRNDFEATIAQQQRAMEVLTAQLNEQAAQIQKVSAHVEMSKAAPQVVVNKP